MHYRLEDDYSDGRNEDYPHEATAKTKRNRKGCRLPHEGAGREPILHRMLSGDVELRKPKTKREK
jgi:hypothetical protein